MDFSTKNSSPYFEWAGKICVKKNIQINKKITQIKDDKLFCISSSVGDLYLKKTTSFIVDEEEAKKLKRNAEYVRTVLESIIDLRLPNTIHHGDLGTYNVRIVEGKCVFYDWGCGGVSHPFFDTFRLLSSSRSKFPPDVPAKKIIVDAYLREWSEYGSHEELINIFRAIDGLAGFYMAYCKYIRTRNLHLLYAEDPKAVNTDALELDHRYSTASIYLKRFIENDFN